MGTFNELWNEVVGVVPGLSHLLAQKYVQRSWKEIRDSRRWSFLVREGTLFAPAVIDTGTVQVTQHNTSVVATGAAKTALDAASNPALTERQFRVQGGPIYGIASYDSGTGTITLDRAYLEASDSAAQFQVYKCYYPAPATGFKGWVSVRDPVDGYWIPRRNLHYMKTDIDRFDPQRGALGPPYYFASHRTTSTGASEWEAWPHPIAERGYMAYYSIRGSDMAADESLPEVIPDLLVIYGALRHAYLWAAAQQKALAELQGTNWLLLRREEQPDFQVALRQAQNDDEAIFLQTYMPDQDGPQLTGPLSDAYLFDHAIGVLGA